MSKACDQKTIENLLKQFISFKSVDGALVAKQQCIDWVQAALLTDDLKSTQKGIHDESPWLYVKHPDSKLLVFAHLDVVPADDSMFSLVVEGDMAKGRGVSDMKGHILPFLMAYADAVKEGTRPPVSILLTTDEEVAGQTIPQLLADGVLSGESAAFTPDSCDLGIVTEHKGAIWADLVCAGSGGHGAYPWNSQNPYYVLSSALEAIKAAFPSGEETDWQLTVSPTVISAGKARNQIPSTVKLAIDIRYPPESYETPEKAIAAVQAVLPSGATVEPVQIADPLYTDSKHPTVALFKEVAEQVLGTEISFRREHGGTDARYFSKAGIPAFLYGPKGGGLHSKDEWVSLESLAMHYSIYRELFTRL